MPFEIIRRNENLVKEEKHVEKFGHGGRIKLCMIYPNDYKAGMSNLGFQQIYKIAFGTPDYYADRAFLPDESTLKLYARGKRKLIAIESEKPVQEFDIIAFSISYEPDYLNVPKIFELAGIPLYSKERDDSHPLVIAGGAAVSINPEVVADFIDLFVIGEGEDTAAKLFNLIRENAGVSRKSLLEKAALISGVYVPSLYDIKYGEDGFIQDISHSEEAPFPVKRQKAGYGAFADSVIITPNTEFSDMLIIEVSRGCPFWCKFCCVGAQGKPFRFRALEDIKNTLDKWIPLTKNIGLLGAAVGSHPELYKILDEINKRGGEAKFSSLRADVIDKDLMSELHRLGQNIITIAPEAGSERLRNIINKKMTDEMLLKTASDAFDAGFSHIRLYFMVGLPEETDEDIDAAVNLIKKIEHIARSYGKSLFVSVNQFIPKPGTPFELYGIEDEEIVFSRLKKLQEPFYGSCIVEFKVENLNEMLVQAFLSRGNRNWSGIIADLYKKSVGNISSKINKLAKKRRDIQALVFEYVPDNKKAPWRIID